MTDKEFNQILNQVAKLTAIILVKSLASACCASLVWYGTGNGWLTAAAAVMAFRQ